MGYALVLAFVGTLLILGIDILPLKQFFSIPHYSYNTASDLHITDLILRGVALIIAEILAIGLRLREDQELTI